MSYRTTGILSRITQQKKCCTHRSCPWVGQKTNTLRTRRSSATPVGGWLNTPKAVKAPMPARLAQNVHAICRDPIARVLQRTLVSQREGKESQRFQQKAAPRIASRAAFPSNCGLPRHPPRYVPRNPCPSAPAARQSCCGAVIREQSG